MITVSLPRNEWENVVLLLTEIRDSDRFSIYLDGIVDTIDHSLDNQEN
jgi:acetone carboxylase gamma subunit